MEIPIKLMSDVKKPYLVFDNKNYFSVHKFDYENLKLLFCNVGGGFIQSLTFDDDRLKAYAKGNIKFVNDLPQVYQYSKITIEGWDKNYVYGYHNPLACWNGWTIPYFTFENAKKVNDLCLIDDLLFRFYDEEVDGERVQTIEYINKHDCEAPWVIEPTFINGIKLWECGLGLTWEIKKD